MTNHGSKFSYRKRDKENLTPYKTWVRWTTTAPFQSTDEVAFAEIMTKSNMKLQPTQNTQVVVLLLTSYQVTTKVYRSEY